jgi:hypothetical protein
MPTSKPITTDAPADFEPTLQDFKGLIVDVRDETRTNNGRDSEWLLFDVAELEVIEAKEPYTLPVATVDIRYLRIPGTQWAVMAASIEKCGYKGDVNGLINKRVHFQYLPAMMNLPKRDEDNNIIQGQYENRQGRAMQITEIEGVENTSNQLEEKLLNMVEGKTAVEFKSAFLSDMSLQQLTGYNDVANHVTQNTFLDMLVATGKLSVDNGVYHKV